MKSRRAVTGVLWLCFAALSWAEKAEPRKELPPENAAKKILAESQFHGGLIVLTGAKDASTALALANAPSSLVHCLVKDQSTANRLRQQIRKAGLYGPVSVMARESSRLPYLDNTVNLLVVSHDQNHPSEQEINRVLAPRGHVWFHTFDGLTSRQKTPSQDTDEWSHTRYDSTGNAVSKDTRVGPPNFLQWDAWPRWNHSTKTSSLVSSQGRIFYILDDSHFSSATRTWSLIARDAHNGIQLWRHVLPNWGGATGNKKVGPAQANRLLAAVGDKVYAALGESVPVSVLDAATGKVIRVLKETDKAEEFIVSDDVLIAMANEGPKAPVGRMRKQMRLVAMDCETGELLWKHSAEQIMPRALAANSEQVVFHDGVALQSLDLRTGAPRWSSAPTGQKIEFRASHSPDQPGSEKGKILLTPQFAPTLVLYQDVVAFAGGRQLNVVSAADGKELWRSDYAASNYSVPVDLFGYDGSLWGPEPAMNLWRPLADDVSYKAFDPQTGEIRKRVAGKYNYPFQHHRCHQMKMVNGKVLASRAGIEFLDTKTGDTAAHHWVRGSCFYGIMPANGLLYAPPHNCACYIRAKLSGFNALNSHPSQSPQPIPAEKRLLPGPAFGKTAENTTPPGPEDWPTYRHDAARSGRATTKVASGLQKGWATQLGGKLTSPVIANGRAYVASTDAHRLHALDAETGKLLWQHDFDARVDSPPTIHRGLVLSGCRDGSVHALRARDGELAWRFRACPEDRMIVSRGQLESVWPVHGSVLAVDETVYFCAGRSSYLDGGIHLFGLNLHTGEPTVSAVLDSRDPAGAEELDEEGVDGYLNDILSSKGERLFLRNNVFDLKGKPTKEKIPHLHGADGFLSDSTTTRLIWTYAPMYTSPHQGAFYDRRLIRYLFPSGRILSEDSESIFGYGRNFYGKMSTEAGGSWALFAAPKKFSAPLDLTAKEYRREALKGKYEVQFHWWKKIPIQVWAMVKTDDVLFIAGPRGAETISQKALDGKEEGLLLAISPADGSTVAEIPIPAGPVWDGMAAAGGKLYLALKNGEVLRLKP